MFIFKAFFCSSIYYYTYLYGYQSYNILVMTMFAELNELRKRKVFENNLKGEKRETNDNIRKET